MKDSMAIKLQYFPKIDSSFQVSKSSEHKIAHLKIFVWINFVQIWSLGEFNEKNSNVICTYDYESAYEIW